METDGSFAYSRVVTVQFDEASELIVYPVPAKEMIWVKGAGLSCGKIQILDHRGNLVHAVRVITATQQVDLSRLPTGMYLIRMGNGIVKKFLKE